MTQKKVELTKKEVEHINKLANLNLNSGEIEKFGGSLTEILNFVGKLSLVETTDVPPLGNVTGRKNVFRKDEARPSMSQKEALANASSTHNGFFKVKAIFER